MDSDGAESRMAMVWCTSSGEMEKKVEGSPCRSAVPSIFPLKAPRSTLP